MDLQHIELQFKEVGQYEDISAELNQLLAAMHSDN